MEPRVERVRSTWKELLRLLRARNFVLLGKIVNLPSTAMLSKRKILPYSAGNLQQSKAKPTSTNEECGKVPQYAVKTLSISAGSFSNRVEMTCGTQPTGKWSGGSGVGEEAGGGVGIIVSYNTGERGSG